MSDAHTELFACNSQQKATSIITHERRQSINHATVLMYIWCVLLQYRHFHTSSVQLLRHVHLRTNVQ
jgi:hypothetical protein